MDLSLLGQQLAVTKENSTFRNVGSSGSPCCGIFSMVEIRRFKVTLGMYGGGNFVCAFGARWELIESVSFGVLGFRRGILVCKLQSAYPSGIKNDVYLLREGWLGFIAALEEL